MKKHIIKSVIPGSIAEEIGFEQGDMILKINNSEIEDIFDYQYLCNDENLEVLAESKDGEQCVINIEKDFDEDLGIEFNEGLMDEYHSCRNKCIFCFIDQNPPGMRETLYFKDDDTRLSFLQGNYVTLTNLEEKDVSRLIKYRMEPINISFQTMNRELRCKMLNNRFAGEKLKYVDEFFKAGLIMNGQIVLCKSVNDGDELRYTLDELLKYVPVLQSVSVVPVGLTKYRDGLYPLEPFGKEDALEVISMIEEYQRKALEISDFHFVHASDEWYILAGKDFPPEETYDGYLQIENGVGMMRNLITETTEYLESETFKKRLLNYNKKIKASTVCTGQSPYATLRYLKGLIFDRVNEILGTDYDSGLADIKCIKNEFFGPLITVSGLITGGDLINALKGESTLNRILIPECMLRSGEEVFLDDVTVSDVQKALQVPVVIVKSSGDSFVDSIVFE